MGSTGKGYAEWQSSSLGEPLQGINSFLDSSHLTVPQCAYYITETGWLVPELASVPDMVGAASLLFGFHVVLISSHISSPVEVHVTLVWILAESFSGTLCG